LNVIYVKKCYAEEWVLTKKTRKEASDPLTWIQTLVRSGNYIPSDHVCEYLADNEFDLGDMESSVLSGRLQKTETDEMERAVDGKKYTIIGRGRNGLGFATVGKLIEWIDGEVYFFITAGKR